MPAQQQKQKKQQNKNLQKNAAKQGQGDDQALATLGGMDVSREDLAKVGFEHPGKALHQLRHGKGPAFKQMGLLQLASERYRPEQEALSKALTDPESQASIQQAEQDLDAQVNLRKEEDPMIGQMQDYISARLGIGLTPQEESAIRGELRAPVEQAYQQAVRSAGQAGAAAGIAPGSGVSLARGQQAQEQLQGARSGVENTIVQEKLQRMRDMERLGMSQEQIEEAARSFDVNAQQAQQALQLRQLGLAEGSLGGLANLLEGEREFDVTETEAKRQAWLARMQAQKYAASQSPSGLDIATGAVGGLLGGLGL